MCCSYPLRFCRSNDCSSFAHRVLRIKVIFWVFKTQAWSVVIRNVIGLAYQQSRIFCWPAQVIVATRC